MAGRDGSDVGHSAEIGWPAWTLRAAVWLTIEEQHNFLLATKLLLWQLCGKACLDAEERFPTAGSGYLRKMSLPLAVALSFPRCPRGVDFALGCGLSFAALEAAQFRW